MAKPECVGTYSVRDHPRQLTQADAVYQRLRRRKLDGTTILRLTRLTDDGVVTNYFDVDAMLVGIAEIKQSLTKDARKSGVRNRLELTETMVINDLSYIDERAKQVGQRLRSCLTAVVDVYSLILSDPMVNY